MSLRWKILLAVVAMLGLLAVSGTLWYHSEADLRRVRAVARAAGVATTWEEAGFVVMSESERAAVDRVVAIGRRYQALAVANFQYVPRQLDPPTPQLIEHDAAIPAEFWNELGMAIDALPATPAARQQRFVLNKPTDEMFEGRTLCRLLGEHVRVVPAEALVPTVLRMAKCCHLTQVQTLMHQLVDDSSVAMLASALMSRRADIAADPQRAHITAALRAMREQWWNGRGDAWRGEAPVMFDAYTRVGEFVLLGHGTASSGDWWQDIKDTGRRWSGLISYRMDREASLSDLVATEVAIVGAVDSAEMMRRVHVIVPPKPVWPWLADMARVQPVVLSSNTMVFGLAKSVLTLDVLIADLEGAPMPPDPFSPTGAALRPVERAGQRIGWYSVGPNGVDDGGDRSKDFGIPLEASFGNPFADLPKPRTP